MAFKKGNKLGKGKPKGSKSPGSGRKKEEAVSIRNTIQQQFLDGIVKYNLIDVCLKRAATGEPKFMEICLDRGLGKVPQAMEHSGDLKFTPVSFIPIEADI